MENREWNYGEQNIGTHIKAISYLDPLPNLGGDIDILTFRLQKQKKLLSKIKVKYSTVVHSPQREG